MFHIINLVLLLAAAASAKHSWCIEKSEESNCNALVSAKPGVDISCHVDTRSNCAQKLLMGEVDVSYFTATELFLLMQSGSNLSIVASVRPESKKSDLFEVETVAVVPKSYKEGLKGLQGGVYCHNGIKDTMNWSPRLFKEFERKVPLTLECTDNKSADEVEIKALESFFGPSCRPGVWSANNDLDKKLKEKSTLCTLCKDGCNDHPTSALECLKANNNETHNKAVAYVDWNQIKQAKLEDLALFSLLCPDGSIISLTPLSYSAPCSFAQQPWGALVSKTEKSTEILATLNSLKTPPVSELKFGADTIIQVQATASALTTYINPMSSTQSPTCIKKHRWCVSAAETDKCTWIQRAAAALGIEPAIACSTSVTCLDDIQKDKADFALVKNQFLNAKEKYHLEPVKVAKNKESEFRIVAVSKTLTNLTSLKDSRACFPEHDGLAQRALISNGNIDKKDCLDKAIADLFKASCSPNASSNVSYKDRLCSLCKPADDGGNATCAANSSNRYYGDDGALKCLVDSTADVAFVDLNKIKVPIAKVNVLCRNSGSLPVDNLASDLPLKAECLLASVSNETVLFARSNMTVSTNVLMDYLNLYFGKAQNKHINFNMYAAFKNTTNLIFDDSDAELSPYDSSSTNIEEFKKQTDLPTCPPPASTKIETTTQKAESKGSSHSEYSILTLIMLTVLSRLV